MHYEDKASKLALEMGALARVTWQNDWAEGEETSVAVATGQWIKALTVAVCIMKAVPWVDMPVPGADPRGWVWLTFSNGAREGLALEIRPDSYRWVQNALGDKKYYQSESLNAVVEGMRATFSRPLVLL